VRPPPHWPIPDPSILPELAKTKISPPFPPVHQHPHSRACSRETTLLSGPEVLFCKLWTNWRGEKREGGIRTVGCSDPKLDSLAGRSRSPLHCPALLCLALPPLPPLPAQPPITKAQSRGGERQSTIAPLRYEPGTAAQTSLRCKGEARRASHSLIGVVRPLNRVSPHTARLVPKFGGSQAKKLSVREGDQRDGVIAQTVASELLSYPFHSDTALR
jgi:hypothetical protein